jgi:hypothetical protein
MHWILFSPDIRLIQKPDAGYPAGQSDIRPDTGYKKGRIIRPDIR